MDRVEEYRNSDLNSSNLYAMRDLYQLATDYGHQYNIVQMAKIEGRNVSATNLSLYDAIADMKADGTTELHDWIAAHPNEAEEIFAGYGRQRGDISPSLFEMSETFGLRDLATEFDYIKTGAARGLGVDPSKVTEDSVLLIGSGVIGLGLQSLSENLAEGRPSKGAKRKELATVTQNRIRHNQAVNDANAKFEAYGLRTETEVTLKSCTGTNCRADTILNDPLGRVSVEVPQGYRATQIVNGQEVSIAQIPLSNGKAQVIVETKTGKARLSGRQETGYNEVSQGTVSGVGNNVNKASLDGAIPADTPVVILRPN